MLIAAAAVLILIAIALLWFSHRQAKISGMPAGRVIFSDMGTWGPSGESLYDPALRLTGKPDYLVTKGDEVIPVEVKSSRAGSAPLDAHIYQLAAYCLLVDRQHHRRPTYGILHYKDATYRVDYTRQLEQAVLDLITTLHRHGPEQQRHRSHVVKGRCSHCGYRSICTERLS